MPTPPKSPSQKIGALEWCLVNCAYEYAAGHLCDLLEFCRQRISMDDSIIFADLAAMVAYYGRHLQPIEDATNGR